MRTIYSVDLRGGNHAGDKCGVGLARLGQHFVPLFFHCWVRGHTSLQMQFTVLELFVHGVDQEGPVFILRFLFEGHADPGCHSD